MAEIKSIYAPQVEADLKKVYSELEKHHKLIIEMSKKSIDFYGGRQAGNPQDLKNATNGYNELLKKQKELEAQIKRLTEAKAKSNVRTSEEIVNQRALAQASDRQARSNSALVGAYARLNAQHQIAMQRVRDLTVQYGAQNQAVIKAQREFDILDRKIKQADQAVRIHNRNVGNYRSALTGLGSSMRSLMGAFGLTSGIFLFAQAITSAFNSIKEFDKANTDLAATMGKNRKEITALTNDAKRLGATTKFTATEVSSLQKEFAKFGFSETEILNATEATLALAAATGSDLATSAMVAAQTLRGFGLDASEMGRVTDVMAMSFTKSALDLSNFTESMKYVAPIAKTAGVSIEFASGMLAKLADAGVKGSMAGTALRRILTEMAKTGLPAEEAFDKIAKSGISVKDAMDDVGRTAQTALIVLSENKEAVLELSSAFEKAGGSAQKMADEQLQSLAGRITLMTSAWDGFIQSLNSGDGIISKTISKLVDMVAGSISMITVLNKLSGELFKGQDTRQKELFDKIAENQKTSLASEKTFTEEKRKILIHNYTLALKEEEYYHKQALNNVKKHESNVAQARGYGAIKIAKERLAQAKKEAKDWEKQINFTKAIIQGTKDYVLAIKSETAVEDENTVGTEKNTKAKKDNVKAKEKVIELLKGTEAWYNNIIKTLKDEQSTLADSTTQYKIYSDAIAEVEKQLDRLKNGIKGVEIQPIKMPKQGNELETRLKAETDAIIEQNQAMEKAIELMRQRADEIINSFGMDFINNSGLTTFFDLVKKGLSQFGDSWEAKTIAIMEATQEMFNFISNLSHAHFEQEYNDLARQKEVSIQFAGESTVAREEIEREYERRRREIQIREAKAKRSQAMFNIGIDMAQGIMRAWAQNTLTAPVMTAIIGALGVAQIAAVASQPLPQFWKGTDNAPEGFAEVGERGRELIKDGKTGEWRLAEKRSVDYLTKGSTVLTNANTEKVLNFHAFNKGLTNVMQENNIDFYPIESKLDKLTNAILNKESFRIVDDSNGKRYYQEKNGQKQALNNARLEIKQRIF